MIKLKVFKFKILYLIKVWFYWIYIFASQVLSSPLADFVATEMPSNGSSKFSFFTLSDWWALWPVGVLCKFQIKVNILKIALLLFFACMLYACTLHVYILVQCMRFCELFDEWKFVPGQRIELISNDVNQVIGVMKGE